MAQLPSGLPETVADDEDVARFLTQSNHFTSQHVQPIAFLPSKDRETSASRHGREPIESLRSIGLAVAEASGRKLYGAAIFKARDVREASLEIVPDEPPNRHAVIRRWPWIENDPKLRKAQQMEHALVLVSASGEPLLFNGGLAWTSG